MTPAPANAAPAAQGGVVAVLDQSLWRDLLAANADEASFATAWLGLACQYVPGALGGVLALRPVAHHGREAGPMASVASWPPGALPAPGLLGAALAAAEAGRGLVQPLAPSGPTSGPASGSGSATRIAYPVALDGETSIGAVALDVVAGPTGAPGRDPRLAMRQLQWAVAWVRDHRRRVAATADRAAVTRMALALDLLAAALEEDRFTAAARVAVTELAIRLRCERVAFGITRHGRVMVTSVSHTAHFGQGMRLIRQLGDAMDEAVDARAVLLHPPPPGEEGLPTRAQALLAAANGTGSVLTVPLLVKDRFVGAVTFERAAGDPFDQETLDLAEATVAILAPALIDKREIDRALLLKAWDAARRQAVALLGPGHAGRKLLAIGVLVLALGAQFVQGGYRVAADARVEGSVQRSMVAPFDGFVAEAPLKAGDVARAGAVLASLDARDLQLERLRWATERQQHADEYEQALSARKRADAVRAQDLVAQADAQIRLADEQIARARLVAPFDGLIISGDLSQTVGAPVRRGDTLFELAPLDDYRVELSVPEDQVADIEVGQHGTLVATALPDQRFPFTVERVTPVATARDGRLVFRVDARLENDGGTGAGRLRPGMEGVGKIEAGQRRVSAIWLRSLLHWVRVSAWRWLP